MINYPLNKHKRRQLGLSLVELLIGLLIGLFALGVMSQVFITTKHSNRVLLAETDLQENARFAFSIITNLVQKSGNLGCKTSNELNTKSLLNFDEDTFRPWRGIEGWDAVNTHYGDTYTTAVDALTLKTPTDHWSGASDSVLDSGISSVPSSDILKVWYISDSSASVSTVSATEVTFPKTDIEQGDVVVLNDCKTLTLLQVCECDTGDRTACSGTDERIDISPAACNSPGNKAFDPMGINLGTAHISKLEQAVFSIGKRDEKQSNISSLFIHRLGKDGKLGAREEILEGVESMQLQYGEDRNNDMSPDYYVSADEVQDWRNVVSIRIGLLMRSFRKHLFTEPQIVNFNGARVSIEEGDSYLRRVYTSTVSLRNRSIGY